MSFPPPVTNVWLELQISSSSLSPTSSSLQSRSLTFSMSSSLPLPPNLPLHRRPFFLLQFNLSVPVLKPSVPFHFKSHICRSTSHSNADSEEVRWLREEQRWLREEQRWLREEQRWARERDALLRQISDLKLRIEALERQNSIQGASASETKGNIAGLLQALNEKGLITEAGSSASPMVLLEGEGEEEKEKKIVVVVEEEKVLRFEEGVRKSRKTLRKGSEGDEVRAMQEALQKLGFYSGEEDMEYSSFSTGTERAVKTWQATQGAPEDGIMTSELLERLYMYHQIVGAGSKIDADQKGNAEGANGAAVASVTEISEIQQEVIKEDGVAEVEMSEHRVFLLGENRWEEPSRLIGRNKGGGNGKAKGSTTKCLTCRGEGRLMCTECDGTGEPNIEPQFVEWVDEEMKCPYCEGLGYTICDVCAGKAMI